MEYVDFVKVNEILNYYINKYKGEYFIRNIHRFFSLVKNINDNCDYIRDEDGNVIKLFSGKSDYYLDEYFNDIMGNKNNSLGDVESTTISLLEGFNLIKEYLSGVEPGLVIYFERKLSDGTFDIIIDEEVEHLGCADYEDGELSVSVHDKKVTISFIVTILHEFIHILDLNGFNVFSLSYSFAEFFSIFYELEFSRFLEEKLNLSDLELYYIVSRYNEVLDLVKKLYFYTYVIKIKMDDGVVDSYSYEIYGDIEKRLYENGLNYLSNMFYDEIKEFDPHVALGYFYGILLSFYLLSQNDKEMKCKVLSMMKEISKKPLDFSLEKIGLSTSLIDSIDFSEVMNNFKDGVVNRIDINTGKNRK